MFKSWVRKVETIGRINAYIEHAVRCSAFGYKARGKGTFPSISAAHNVLTTHLMHLLMFCLYI